ncbi:MAG: cation diffusion facilitator family transporter [Ramlibacter sp.]
MSADQSTRFAVYAALVGNLLVATTKAGAAFWTGSSSMLSEAVHSFVDTGNEVLLLYGMHRAKGVADQDHPVGYGRELYFWSFIVAVLVFALGAGVSVFEGVTHMRNPAPVEDAVVNYVVLGLSFVFEGVSWVVSLRQFNAARGSMGLLEAFRRSKDPPSFMILFEDSAALVGIALAAGGTFASASLDRPELDGLASILIGLVLAATAVLLARESKSLLIGERADSRLSDSILRIAGQAKAVVRANGVITVQLAPDQVVAALSLEFADELRTPDIEAAVVDIEKRLQLAHPEVTTLFVKPQSSHSYRGRQQDGAQEADLFSAS